ncbi:MAG TPA: hypothetical protein VE573_06730 [Nitrososphaeraceae archaeon]|nr:hypothetical protein [Nitrososphaeraceae archaeon]
MLSSSSSSSSSSSKAMKELSEYHCLKESANDDHVYVNYFP